MRDARCQRCDARLDVNGKSTGTLIECTVCGAEHEVAGEGVRPRLTVEPTSDCSPENGADTMRELGTNGGQPLNGATGTTERRGADLTEESLTRERNIFLFGLIGLVALTFLHNLAVLGGYAGADPATLDAIAVAGTLISKAAAVYLAFRLSRFLHQPVWLTVIYCILIPFSVIYLIPFIGLLTGVGRARREIVARQSPATGGGAQA